MLAAAETELYPLLPQKRKVVEWAVRRTLFEFSVCCFRNKKRSRCFKILVSFHEPPNLERVHNVHKVGAGNKGSKSWLHLLWCVHEDLDFRSHQEHVDGLILFVLRVVRRLVRSQTGAVLWQSPRRDARQETQTTGKAARARTAGMEFRRSCT